MSVIKTESFSNDIINNQKELSIQAPATSFIQNYQEQQPIFIQPHPFFSPYLKFYPNSGANINESPHLYSISIDSNQSLPLLPPPSSQPPQTNNYPVQFTISPYPPQYPLIYPQQVPVSPPVNAVFLAPQPHPLPVHQPNPPETTFNKQNRIFVPLYCGTCQMYGCQCFYGTNEPKQTPTPVQNVSQEYLNQAPSNRPAESNLKSASKLTIQQQHQHYANAAAMAYFNYIQVSLQQKNDLNQTLRPNTNELSDHFNKSLKINPLGDFLNRTYSSSTSGSTTNQSKLRSSSSSSSLSENPNLFYQQQHIKALLANEKIISSSYLQTGPAPLHSTIHPHTFQQNKNNYATLPNIVNSSPIHYQKPKQTYYNSNKQYSKQNKKFAAYESVYSSSPTPSSSPSLTKRKTTTPTTIFNRNTTQTLCRHGLSCKFKRENKCRFYHPPNESLLNVTTTNISKSKQKTIDINDYSIDDKEIDFCKIEDDSFQNGVDQEKANESSKPNLVQEAQKLNNQVLNSNSLSSSSSSLSSSKTLTNLDVSNNQMAKNN